MLVELDEEHTKCGICIAKFSSDRDNKDPEIRKHLPVLSSSQRCDHWFCHGCILREQQRVAEDNNGRIPKWIKCMHCREKTSFNPAEPKYHRLLIDLLARAQKYAAAQVKNEEQEERTISAGTKRKTPSETAETAPEKSKSKMEEGTSKSDDDDGAKETATHQHQDLRSRLVCENLERLNDLFQLFHQQTFDLAKRLGTTVFEQGKPVEQAAALASHYNQAMQHLDKLAEERDGLLTALNCIAESIAEAR